MFRAREQKDSKGNEERKRKKDRKRQRKREDTRWTAGSGRRGWVSTGVSWLVWWANVCLLAASEPVNHYGPRKRLRTTFALSFTSSYFVSLSFSPFSVFSLPVFKPRLHSCRLSLPRVSSFSLSLRLPPFPSYIHPLVPSFACSSPSFPSVPSSPRCSLLQARYNAARRRPSCIFKRAVLLCSRYRSHHLDRPLDDRSPPSPTSGPPSPCDSRSFPCPLSIFLPSLRVLS